MERKNSLCCNAPIAIDPGHCDEGFNIIQHAYDVAVGQIGAQRDKVISDRLGMLGFLFETDEERASFSKKYLFIVTGPDHPLYKMLYLDHPSRERILIAEWWNTLEVIPEPFDLEKGYSFKYVAGNPPK